MWTIAKAFLKDYWKPTLDGIVLAAVFFGGVYIEALRWEAAEGRALKVANKALVDAVIRQNAINQETKANLAKAETDFVGLFDKMKHIHETPHTNCVATPASLRTLSEATDRANHR